MIDLNYDFTIFKFLSFPRTQNLKRTIQLSTEIFK